MATILIADDDVDFCAVLTDALALMGHDARTVHRGEDALAALEAAPAEIAMLDVLMPAAARFPWCTGSARAGRRRRSS